MAYTPKMHSITGLAVETGIDRRTLAKRLAKLEPAEKRGRVRYWLLRDVLRYLEDQAAPAAAAPAGRSNGSTDYEDERTRLTRAKARLAELEEQQKRGELVPVAEVQGFLTTVLSRVRQGCLTLPARTAPRLHDAKSIPELERIVLEDVEEVLREISETEVVFTATDEAPDRRVARARGGRGALVRANGAAT